MTHVSASTIRQTFIDFFRARGHSFVPSSPTVPHDDPTLLFANAGMNQFKPIFLGQVDPSSPLASLKRAVNSQKCIRAGGKHNDLEDVGKDTYHHTFFEMLGNWSFGDYFKVESIDWAWELLTKVFGLPADRLYATYFGGDEKQGLAPDEEARQLWLRYLPDDHVLPGNMKDNFWEMGETGPCGPCSEIHFDRIGGRNARAFVNRDDPNVIEIWNLVFIQFDRQADASLRPLPARHVDTGMGLERLVSILQAKSSNYDTDVFMPIFAAIERTTGDARGYHGRLGKDDIGEHDMAYRVIADHIRTLTFALTDGAIPSNEGRGYVLRRILRRAVRYGRQKLGAKTGFLSQLVPTVVETMGDAFPELRRDPKGVAALIYEEEESFGKTLDRGIGLFEEIAASASGTIAGTDAFKLYDTFGFPLDLTQLMAAERGMSVDVEGFEACMAEQKARSRAGGKAGSNDEIALDTDAIARLQHLRVRPTDDSHKFHARDIRATVRAIWNGQNFDEHTGTRATQRVAIILDKTNFYAEMGGQVCDHGRMLVSREARTGGSSHGGEFKVEEVRSLGGYVLHIGHIKRGELRVGDDVHLHIENQRRQQISANHTATHLLNFALRKVLGATVDQKGSLVAPDRLRFDFNSNRPVEPGELAEVERLVRDAIARDLPVHADLGPLMVARGITGLRAVFGETYPDPVRIISIGAPVTDLLDSPEKPDWAALSVELCGGTHLARTGQAGAFALVSEEGIAKGVRRITALTGAAATAASTESDALAARIAAVEPLRGAALAAAVTEVGAAIDAATLPAARKHELRSSLASLAERVKAEHKAQSASRASEASGMARQIAEMAAGSMDPIIIAALELGSDRDALTAAMNTIRQRAPTIGIMLLSADHEAGKVSVMATVPKTLIAKGLKAGDWVREVVGVLGGKGGGSPEMAQGAGPEIGKLRDAASHARSCAFTALS
ncbi:MAG: alanine--tRNA ligase [Phycisphaeraceae bacterium]|nr:alanine--tRNA ligase [Phycisphaeraceae bacterium]MCW5763348.1 alanine--tRNA ligase [Phycisphaeraceae bacterium]